MPWKNSMIQCHSSIVTNIVPYPPEGAAHLRWKLKMWSTVHPHRASSSHLDRGGFTPTPQSHSDISVIERYSGATCSQGHAIRPISGRPANLLIVQRCCHTCGNSGVYIQKHLCNSCQFCTCMLSGVYTSFHLLLALVQKHRPDSCFLTTSVYEHDCVLLHLTCRGHHMCECRNTK